MASEADCATLNLKAAIKYSSTGGNLRVLTSPMHNRSKCYAFPPSRDEHVVDVVPSGGGALRPRVEVAVDRRVSKGHPDRNSQLVRKPPALFRDPRKI